MKADRGDVAARDTAQVPQQMVEVTEWVLKTVFWNTAEETVDVPSSASDGRNDWAPEARLTGPGAESQGGANRGRASAADSRKTVEVLKAISHVCVQQAALERKTEPGEEVVDMGASKELKEGNLEQSLVMKREVTCGRWWRVCVKSCNVWKRRPSRGSPYKLR